MLRISGRSSGQPQSNHWQKIIENLNVLLKVLQDNHVCISLFDSLFICDSLQLDVCLTIVLFVPRYPRSWLRKFSPRYSHTLMYSYSIGELIFWSFDFCMCGSLCSRWSLFVLQSPPSSWVLLLQQWRVRQGWPSWVGIVVCKGNSWGDMPAVWFRGFFLYIWFKLLKFLGYSMQHHHGMKSGTSDRLLAFWYVALFYPVTCIEFQHAHRVYLSCYHPITLPYLSLDWVRFAVHKFGWIRKEQFWFEFELILPSCGL
jgi:hypothetical protein